MTEPAPPNAVDTPEGPPVGDLGRRLARRRADLGLTRGETAARAGMAPSYLRHLEEHPSAAPDASVLRRLAGALETTVTALSGGDADLPPGQGRAALHPRFTELSVRECRALLSTHGVGRLAMSTASGPIVVPVNYSVVDGAVVFRTDPGATPSQALDSQVAFEVDRVDDTLSQGWSVLVRGRARAVTDPDAVRLLKEGVYSTPWAGGDRDLWLRIDPVVVTGRRIAV